MLPLVHSSQTAASRAEARQDAHGAYSHPSAVPRSAGVCYSTSKAWKRYDHERDISDSECVDPVIVL